MGDPANFNTVLQFCVKSIIEKIPKIQMGTPPNLTTAEVKVAQYLRTKKSENSNFYKNHSDFQVPTKELYG